MKVRHLVLTKKLSQREVSSPIVTIPVTPFLPLVSGPVSPALSSLTPRGEGPFQYLYADGQLYEADRHLPAKDQRSIKRLYEALVREGSPDLTIRCGDMPITNVLFRRLVTFPWSLMQATHCNLIGAMKRPSLGELNARFMWRTSACVTAVNPL